MLFAKPLQLRFNFKSGSMAVQYIRRERRPGICGAQIAFLFPQTQPDPEEDALTAGFEAT